jgi:hypothetical protein
MTAAMWTLPNVLGPVAARRPFLGAALVVAGDTPEVGLEYGVKASALVRAAASPVHHGGTPAAVQPFDGATPLFLSGLGRQQGGGGGSSRVRS